MHFGDFTVERPKSSSTGKDPWRLYDSLGRIKEFDTQFDCQYMVSERWVALLEIMSSLGHIL